MSGVPIVTFHPGIDPLGPAVVAIGVFDGVHRGHQALVGRASASASGRGVPCIALTFDRDPDQVVTPDESSPQLLALADKSTFLRAAGADIVLVVPFDENIASMSPDQFVSRVLCVSCTPSVVHVGVDFRFGRFAAGNVADLTALGGGCRFTVEPFDLVEHRGAPVTSTRIRGLVARGDVAGAAELLGRPHRVRGMVVKGRGEGRARLGIPTANILPVEHAALPAAAVYAGRVLLPDGDTRPAGISVGVPPTFPHAHDVLEAHLIGFEGELLHAEVVLEFEERLREQRAFETMGELATAMRADFERVQALVPGRASR